MNDFRKELLRPRQNRVVLVISVLALILALGLTIFLLRENERPLSVPERDEARERELNDQVALLMNQIKHLGEQLEVDSERIGMLVTDLETVQKKVGVTQNELEKARAATEQMRQEQQKKVQLLTRQLVTKADAAKIETLAEQTDILLQEINQFARVQEKALDSQQDLETKWEDLSKMGLRLTEQGKLIATRPEALEELRRRGAREYLQFDARKSEKVRVADVVIELTKTDYNRKRADLRLIYDDKQSLMKKVYINTTLVFYVDTIQYELVIYKVSKDQIAGYISLPRYDKPISRKGDPKEKS
jgi:uncharacterized protein (DUF3084 family)